MFSLIDWFSFFGSGWLNAFSWFSLGGFIVAAILAHFLGLRPLLEAFAQGVVWFWQNVLWKGIKDIFDDWVTIVTVITVCFTMYTALEVKQELHNKALVSSLSSCQGELQKIRRSIPKLPKDFGKSSGLLDFLFK